MNEENNPSHIAPIYPQEEATTDTDKLSRNLTIIRRQKSSYKTLQICNFYFSPIRYSHVKQCSDNYQISIKSKTSYSQYIFAHFDTKFAYILLL